MRDLVKHNGQQYRQGPDRNLSYGLFQDSISSRNSLTMYGKAL
jgi:hypothetical protein